MVSFSAAGSFPWRQVAGAVLEYCFPRTCLGCGRLLCLPLTGYTCPECRRGYLLIRGPVCRACGRPLFGEWGGEPTCRTCLDDPPGYGRARALFLYRLAGARLVHCLKYENGSWLVPEMERLLCEDPQWQEVFRDAALVPVPLHPRKLRRRGYNQAGLVARAINRAVPGTGIEDCLRRIRDTPSQTALSRPARQRNMRGAFRVRHRLDPTRNWMLIDDVLTTGSTLNAAARALRQGGAKSISAFTLARG